MADYDLRVGVWPTTGWWNSANALTTLTDYMIKSGDHRYAWVLDNTYNKKRNALQGNFINSFIDDTGWWALAWIRGYDLTGDPRFLQVAKRGVDFMWQYADDVCGGGLWWTTSRSYKNAISSELFIKAAAELHNRVPGDTRYLQQALQVWDWFDSSGLINDQLLINDGLSSSTCRNNGDQTWTYNQGVVLGGLVALHQATGDIGYLQRARELADASATSDALHVDGVLTEPCEATGCDTNGVSFKGIYVRNLGELNDALEDQPYSGYLTDQANSAYKNDRDANGRYGVHWAGPIAGVNAATQQSAVDLLVAAQPRPEQPTSGSGSTGSTTGPAVDPGAGPGVDPTGG
ncbi:glycoside hydrolase family 76 protein [Nakamurella lactea]|uniref:glycoside hydrolase family 76 protein n=1 Tax=Nakamurella lactea TaxID=459515 RepID=UPI001B7FE074|nr:glycoside hydrolase family 76 protein [Nakamurella lactea]